MECPKWSPNNSWSGHQARSQGNWPSIAKTWQHRIVARTILRTGLNLLKFLWYRYKASPFWRVAIHKIDLHLAHSILQGTIKHPLQHVVNFQGPMGGGHQIQIPSIWPNLIADITTQVTPFAPSQDHTSEHETATCSTVLRKTHEIKKHTPYSEANNPKKRNHTLLCWLKKHRRRAQLDVDDKAGQQVK